MAIEFKSAPGGPQPVEAAEGEGAGFDLIASLDASGDLKMALLMAVVLGLFGIVTYLRVTPGFRVSDVSVKRRPAKPVAVQRESAPDAQTVKTE